MGTLRLLEAVRMTGYTPRIYNAASSEMYGGGPMLSESSRFDPKSPYGSAKVFSFNLCKNYRESFGLYVTNGILFNHESPRRGSEFVTKSIVEQIARAPRTGNPTIVVGNKDARRDWGYAPEYVAGMVDMLKLDAPTDMVLATGEDHSVEEFAQEACKVAGVGCMLVSDPSRLRPNDIDVLSGNPEKAQANIGWNPKVRFKELVRIMVEAELSRA
jgi:GDPmannose 4,6-dehydratase